MTKIIIGVVALIIIGVGGYMLMPKNQAPVSETTTNTETAQNSEPSTLRALMASGGSQKCTFNSSTANSQSEGVVYIGQGQLRGDFTSVASGQTQNGHFIVKDNTTHLWVDGMSQGFKAEFSASASASSGAGEINPDAPVDYKCSSWTTDPSMFVLPSSVTFRTMAEMMPTLPR